MKQNTKKQKNLFPLLVLGIIFISCNKKQSRFLYSAVGNLHNNEMVLVESDPIIVLGFARTGLIFTRLQEGTQPGGGG